MLINQFLNKVYKNNLDDIKEFLTHHSVDINTVNYSGETALTMAINNKNQPLVKYLIEQQGARVDLENIDLLAQAIRSENIEAIHYLTESNLFFTPLPVTQKSKYEAILSENKAILNQVFADKDFTISSDQVDYLAYAIDYHKNKSIEFFIAEKNYNFKENGGRYYAPFLAALSSDNETIFKSLLNMVSLNEEEKKDLFKNVLQVYQQYVGYVGEVMPNEKYLTFLVELEKDNLNLLRQYVAISKTIKINEKNFQHFGEYIEAGISMYEKNKLDSVIEIKNKNQTTKIKQKI